MPANYAKAQNEWIENFFLQNGYLEYDALSRLGISDPKSTIKRKFVNDNITFLRSCCIGENVRNIAEIQVNLCQKLLFLHQLTHNMTTDCLWNYHE